MGERHRKAGGEQRGAGEEQRRGCRRRLRDDDGDQRRREQAGTHDGERREDDQRPLVEAVSVHLRSLSSSARSNASRLAPRGGRNLVVGSQPAGSAKPGMLATLETS